MGALRRRPAQDETNPTQTSLLERRAFLAATAGGVGGLLLGGTAGTAVASTGADTASSDPSSNPNWPYASDGLLYNYVSGTVINVQGDSLLIRVAEPITSHVSVQVMPGVEILCRGLSAATLADLIAGDRVEVGTYFAQADQRVANWVVINGLSGWSDISEVTDPYISIVPSSGSPYADSSIRLLRVTPATRVNGGDGINRHGTAETLQPGDHITWTGIAESPGSDHGNVWAVAVNYLQQES